MCPNNLNIDAHVEGEQFHESKQSSYKDGKVRYEFPRSCQSRRDLPRDNSLVSVEVLRYDYKRSNVNKGIVRTEMELVLEHTQQGTSNEVSDYIKMEMQIPRSSRVKFIATCSYSRLNDFITSRKNDPKLPQTLISTSSSICYGERFVLKPFLYTMMGDLFDQVLEADPDAFDVFVDPLFESEDHVCKGQGGILSSHSTAFPLIEK
ncbi:hypothetical protein Tco_0999802 [Tanacetum coccineum]